MSITRVTLCGVLLSVALLDAQAPDGGLPRRSWLGVALAPHESGAVITAVVDGSSAALEGLRAGDVIKAVDGSAVRTPQDVVRRPAVMLIGGGGCGSIDLPMAPDVAASGLLRTIARQGYVTMRVEKSGLGDSRGPACDAIGYIQELDGYRAALVALKRHPSVNIAEVFLLGISLGGVFAPILANESPVRGIVAYGTLGSAPSPYPGRSERFFREFAAADVKGAWSDVRPGC
jgi:pimeloyl-ACP methyl ester carboxylesterase